jgi:hypothetical protein
MRWIGRRAGRPDVNLCVDNQHGVSLLAGSDPGGMLRDIEHHRTLSRARAVERGYIVTEVRA